MHIEDPIKEPILVAIVSEDAIAPILSAGTALTAELYVFSFNLLFCDFQFDLRRHDIHVSSLWLAYVVVFYGQAVVILLENAQHRLQEIYRNI